MRRLVASFIVILVSLLSVFTIATPSHASQGTPLLNENCLTPYCYSDNWWGGTGSGDQSYGVDTTVPWLDCFPAGSSCLNNSYAYVFHGVVDQTANHSANTGGTISQGRIELGILYLGTVGGGGRYCKAGTGTGTFAVVNIWNTSGSQIVKQCIPLNSTVGNPGDEIEFKFAKYVSSGGGINVWITDDTSGYIVCDPDVPPYCGYPSSNGEATTYYFTMNYGRYYDDGSHCVVWGSLCLTTANWTYNSYQKTDGTWHYQTNSGTIEHGYDPPSQMWWNILPANSSTGGDLNWCVADIGCPSV